eukprot:4159353-Amphidinium_carterae.1
MFPDHNYQGYQIHTHFDCTYKEIATLLKQHHRCNISRIKLWHGQGDVITEHDTIIPRNLLGVNYKIRRTDVSTLPQHSNTPAMIPNARFIRDHKAQFDEGTELYMPSDDPDGQTEAEYTIIRIYIYDIHSKHYIRLHVTPDTTIDDVDIYMQHSLGQQLSQPFTHHTIDNTTTAINLTGGLCAAQFPLIIFEHRDANTSVPATPVPATPVSTTAASRRQTIVQHHESDPTPDEKLLAEHHNEIQIAPEDIDTEDAELHGHIYTELVTVIHNRSELTFGRLTVHAGTTAKRVQYMLERASAGTTTLSLPYYQRERNNTTTDITMDAAALVSHHPVLHLQQTSRTTEITNNRIMLDDIEVDLSTVETVENTIRSLDEAPIESTTLYVVKASSRHSDSFLVYRIVLNATTKVDRIKRLLARYLHIAQQRLHFHTTKYTYHDRFHSAPHHRRLYTSQDVPLDDNTYVHNSTHIYFRVLPHGKLPQYDNTPLPPSTRPPSTHSPTPSRQSTKRTAPVLHSSSLRPKRMVRSTSSAAAAAASTAVPFQQAHPPLPTTPNRQHQPTTPEPVPRHNNINSQQSHVGNTTHLREELKTAPVTPPARHLPSTPESTAEQNNAQHQQTQADDIIHEFGRSINTIVLELQRLPVFMQQLRHGGGRQELTASVRHTARQHLQEQVGHILTKDQIALLCQSATNCTAINNSHTTTQRLICIAAAARRAHLHREAQDIDLIFQAREDYDPSRRRKRQPNSSRPPRQHITDDNRDPDRLADDSGEPNWQPDDNAETLTEQTAQQAHGTTQPHGRSMSPRPIGSHPHDNNSAYKPTDNRYPNPIGGRPPTSYTDQGWKPSLQHASQPTDTTTYPGARSKAAAPLTIRPPTPPPPPQRTPAPRPKSCTQPIRNSHTSQTASLETIPTKQSIVTAPLTPSSTNTCQAPPPTVPQTQTTQPSPLPTGPTAGEVNNTDHAVAFHKIEGFLATQSTTNTETTKAIQELRDAVNKLSDRQLAGEAEFDKHHLAIKELQQLFTFPTDDDDLAEHTTAIDRNQEQITPRTKNLMQKIQAMFTAPKTPAIPQTTDTLRPLVHQLRDRIDLMEQAMENMTEDQKDTWDLTKTLQQQLQAQDENHNSRIAEPHTLARLVDVPQSAEATPENANSHFNQSAINAAFSAY